MAEPWLEKLNDAQREAATYDGGPLLVVAGAGTGKTRTLACRVANLIERGTPPDRILLLTFTRRAAAQMITQVRHMVQSAGVTGVWGGTFHATANRLLRIYGSAVNLPDGFTVMDQGDAADMMSLIRAELGVAKAKRRFPTKQTLVKIYSYTVNAQTPLSDTLARHFPWCGQCAEQIATIFQRYTEQKERFHVVDYDDLLLYWRMLCAAPRIGSTVADRFDHLVVDEYQDTNAVQREIVLSMRKSHPGIMAVGDDAQAIYSFRAATVRNILEFPTDFPGTHVVTLEQNYRSTQPILAAANAVMDQASERYTKNLRSDRESPQKPVLLACQDEAEQCELVCERILDHFEQGIPLTQQAVLFRASHHSAQLEVELQRRNLPFHKYGGLKFIETAHIKDVLAFLRILENPADELSWFRVLQLLEGIGPHTARRILDHLQGVPTPDRSAAAHTPLASPLHRLFVSPPAVPASARESFAALRGALADCCGVPLGDTSTQEARPEPRAEPIPASSDSGDKADRRLEPPLPVQLERIRSFYEPVCERIHENSGVRMRDLEQLEQIATRYRSRQRFITDLTLDPPTSTSDLAQPPHLDDDYLILSTIHSAKGCEWTSVHIIHAADGMIPSDMAVSDEAGVDEERRLFYVAMTRAKDHLFVYSPLRYYHTKHRRGDAHSYAQLTRFITTDVRRHFEDRVTPEDCEAKTDAPTDPHQLRDWLNDLWQA